MILGICWFRFPELHVYLCDFGDILIEVSQTSCVSVKKLENFIKLYFLMLFCILWSQKNQAWHFLGGSEIIVMVVVGEGRAGDHIPQK